MKNTAIIIPAYNESARLASVLETVCPLFPLVVVVDDGSRDETAAIAQKFTTHVLRHAVNIGKGGAMRTGAEYAWSIPEVEHIIFMDGDGQHAASELVKFLASLEQGNDIVFGVRDIWGGMPRARGVGNHLVSRYVQWRYGIYIQDILSGFKGFNRSGYAAVQWHAKGYEVELEIAVHVARQKLPFAEVSIATIYHDLERGMNVLDALRLMSKFPLWK